MADHLTEDVLLTNAACDQLGRLRSEVEDEDLFVLGGNRSCCWRLGGHASPDLLFSPPGLSSNIPRKQMNQPTSQEDDWFQRRDRTRHPRNGESNIVERVAVGITRPNRGNRVALRKWKVGRDLWIQFSGRWSRALSAGQQLTCIVLFGGRLWIRAKKYQDRLLWPQIRA
jgi:hypothetical protein